ncbi:MAG: hypothetical protein H0X50_10465 [Nitrosopumilus sp.]|nr:hypothetical protein [Nitrosopumilus sp.]
MLKELSLLRNNISNLPIDNVLFYVYYNLNEIMQHNIVNQSINVTSTHPTVPLLLFYLASRFTANIKSGLQCPITSSRVELKIKDLLQGIISATCL